MASQAYKNNGAIVIWFDETEGGEHHLTLPEIVISPLAKGNAYNSTLLHALVRPEEHAGTLRRLRAGRRFWATRRARMT